MSNCAVLAVASGKGGVGKTLTSVNLAMNTARSGIRVAVVDADPLSNIMTMMDHPIPDKKLPKKLRDPESQTYSVAPQFEVIFPQAKEQEAHAANLTNDLLKNHRDWLNQRYGLVIIDMPAGVGSQETFPYLTETDALVLVTNPEPTAHVAAGTLLKGLLPVWSNRPIFLWHNKYESHPEDKFDSDDVIGNYNRNVNAHERISPPSIVQAAFVPPDPALDLTKADPPILIDLHRILAGTLEGLADAAMPPLPQTGTGGSRSATLIAYFLRRFQINDDPDAALAGLQKFLSEETGTDKKNLLPEKLKNDLARWFALAAESPIRRQIKKTLEVINLYILELESNDGKPVNTVSRKALDREMLPLLKTLSCLPPNSPLRRLSGFLLFRYSVLKLFSNASALKFILGFLPRRMEAGQSVRDRRRQIAGLIGKDAISQGRYIALVKKLYPVVIRQLNHLVNMFSLQDLLFNNDDGNMNKSVYIKLFGEAIYEIINSGLGIVAGFRFRHSSRAFQQGCDTLMAHLTQKTKS